MGGKGGISRRSLVIVGATVGTSFKLAAQDRGSETVEIVDSETHVERLLPILDEMVTEGLVTVEKVRVLKYTPGTRPPVPGG